ncbi:MAG TPA: hypothetical protein VHR64_13755 [Thermomicrobiales bacterium]|jgi:hypothetical protein|nr:hypothetical protein [Thermomicrobiales bacterium]
MEIEATVEGMQRIAIHGSPYVRVFYSLDDDRETIHQAQLPDEAVDANIRVGDRVRLTMLLRTVMEVRRLPVSG